MLLFRWLNTLGKLIYIYIIICTSIYHGQAQPNVSKFWLKPEDKDLFIGVG